MPPTCACLCHRTDHGKFNAAFHARNWNKALRICDNEYFDKPASVLADDPVEAAIACSVCINKHCPALLDRPPAPPRKSPVVRPLFQADGDGD
jgi:hypothetical protein